MKGMMQEIDLLDRPLHQLLLTQQADQQVGVTLGLYQHDVFHDLLLFAIPAEVDFGFTQLAPPENKKIAACQ
jgi:hypothetical protein